MLRALPNYLCWLLLWLIIPLCPNLQAQTAVSDSLKKILPGTEDTTRVQTLNKIAYHQYIENPKEAIEYANRALTLSINLNYTEGLGNSYHMIGLSNLEINEPDEALKNYFKALEYFAMTGNQLRLGELHNEIGIIYKNSGAYDRAITYYLKAMEVYEEINAPLAKGDVLLNLGQVYSYLGNYEKSVENYIKSIKIWEEQGDKKGLALANGNLGNLYYNLKDYGKALEYFKTAEVHFLELNEKFYLANVLNNMGLIYNNFKENEKALEHFQKAYDISEELDYINGMAFGLSNIGKIYQEQTEYLEAIEKYEAALLLFKETGNKSSIAARMTDLGEVYTNTGQYDLALSYLTQGLEIAKEINDAERALICYKTLFEFYEATKKYSLSLEFYKRYAALKDSVFNIQKSKQIAEIQTRYETEKKEQENELLRKESAIREETISRKEVQNRMLLIGILFILSFAGYFYVVYKQKQKTNHLLRKQNEEIHLKQEEIITINASLQDSQNQLSQVNEELQRLNSNLENTIRERTSALEKSNVELDTFLYQSSHALRRPIVSIMGLIQIVRMEKNPEQINIIRDKVEDTAKKMDLMLRKLVMASEINISQFDPLKPIDFQWMVQETWNSLKPPSDICFKSVIEPLKDFMSKEVLIHIILNNILENAILYTSELTQNRSKPKVRVTIKKQGENILIEIADNGVGIEPEQSERIFDMFIVANDKPKGYGLGLYIVKKAVEKLHGHIQVACDENKFTCFQIYLPIDLPQY